MKVNRMYHGNVPDILAANGVESLDDLVREATSLCAGLVQGRAFPGPSDVAYKAWDAITALRLTLAPAAVPVRSDHE